MFKHIYQTAKSLIECVLFYILNVELRALYWIGDVVFTCKESEFVIEMDDIILFFYTVENIPSLLIIYIAG